MVGANDPPAPVSKCPTSSPLRVRSRPEFVRCMQSFCRTPRCRCRFAQNRDLLYEYIREVWQEGDPAAATKFISPAYKRHISPALPPLDPDGQIKRLIGFRAAFPDIEITVEEVIVDDDRLAFRSVMRGTHRGEFLGIAPTGKKVTVGLVDVIHFKGWSIPRAVGWTGRLRPVAPAWCQMGRKLKIMGQP